MALITYDNKVALNENPEIANINKVTDDDMNEIKNVTNQNYNHYIEISTTEPTATDGKLWINPDDVILMQSGIVESGSNANGSWIKYSDGTMICYVTKSLLFEISTAWGNLYEGSADLGSWPQTFIDTPVVLVNNVGTRGAIVESFNPITTNSTIGTLWLARPSSSSTSLTYVINVVGYGKWK